MGTMKTTRQRIVEQIEKKKAISADEISLALHLTPANIRHHLSVLIAEGLVERVGKRPAQGRGRPVLLYGLVQQAGQHNLNGLAAGALNVLAHSMPEEEWLEKLANELVRDAVTNDLRPAQKLYHAIQHLNMMNYDARWEAHAEGPRIILSHCPYATILPQHLELCRLDALLLQQMLGCEVQQIARLHPGPHGLPQCVFRMDRL